MYGRTPYGLGLYGYTPSESEPPPDDPTTPPVGGLPVNLSPPRRQPRPDTRKRFARSVTHTTTPFVTVSARTDTSEREAVELLLL